MTRLVRPSEDEPATKGSLRSAVDRDHGSQGRDPASFRDPGGFVYWRNGRVYRQINAISADDWHAFLSSGLCERLISDALLVPHREADLSLALDEGAVEVIEPDLVPVVTKPYEWSFSQLKDAALLTLAIQQRALDARMSLKDASAFNVQFVNGRPIFIDTLSFERASDGPWVAYRQFCQHFLAPLALIAYRDPRCGLMLRPFIDGIPLDLAGRLLPLRTRFRLGLGVHIHAHARAQRQTGADAARRASSLKMSETRQRAMLDSLRRTVEGLRWKPEGTRWADYNTRTSYTEAGAESKQRIVRSMLEDARSGQVWDLGANNGTFSLLAAAMGREVIAIDSDPAAIEQLYLRVRRDEIRNLTPLVIDLANPSPALGWALHERRSIVERGHASVILALALIHHLAIGNNVPLPDIAAFLGTFGDELIIEFVPKQDPQTQTLLAARKDVFPDYSVEGFRSAFGRYFTIVSESPIADSARVLFHMRKE